MQDVLSITCFCLKSEHSRPLLWQDFWLSYIEAPPPAPPSPNKNCYWLRRILGKKGILPFRRPFFFRNHFNRGEAPLAPLLGRPPPSILDFWRAGPLPSVQTSRGPKEGPPPPIQNFDNGNPAGEGAWQNWAWPVAWNTLPHTLGDKPVIRRGEPKHHL